MRYGTERITYFLFLSFCRDFKQWSLRFLCSNSLGKRTDVLDTKTLRKIIKLVSIVFIATDNGFFLKKTLKCLLFQGKKLVCVRLILTRKFASINNFLPTQDKGLSRLYIVFRTVFLQLI